MTTKDELFNHKLKVVNIGIDAFAKDLEKQGVKVIQVDWRPPAGGDKELIQLLDRLK